jgi:hypothetical protein
VIIVCCTNFPLTIFLKEALDTEEAKAKLRKPATTMVRKIKK